MHLLALPEEILDHCCHHANASCLKALRLTNSQLVASASKHLFEHVDVQPTTKSVARSKLVLEHTSLNPLVKSVTFNTSLRPNAWPHQTDYGEKDMKEAQLSKTFAAALHKIGRFGNVSRVSLKFAVECAAEETNFMLQKYVAERPAFRNRVLQALIKGLVDARHPADQLRALEIKNLQNIVDVDVCESESFQRLLSRFTSLSLRVTSEFKEQSSLEKPELHRFFNHELKTYWLHPVQAQLVHLKLYSAYMEWGYFPSCDLRSLHFPKLSSLALGSMTFTHDWQLEWILSHASTLRSLILDDCPIIIASSLFADTGPHRDPPALELFHGPTGYEWYFAARWHDYFRRITEGLPKLTHFGYGSLDSVNDFEDCFELSAAPYASRYCIIHTGTLPSHLCYPRRKTRWEGKKAVPDGYYFDSCWESPPPYPECDEEDQEALNELLAVIAGRKAGEAWR